MNDPSTREFVGPKNLWKQIREGDSAPEAQTYRLCPSSPISSIYYIPPPYRVGKIARFPDGKPGFKVTYRQDMGNRFFKPGITRSYLVRYGLSREDQRRVALAIFMEVSVKMGVLLLFFYCFLLGG